METGSSTMGEHVASCDSHHMQVTWPCLLRKPTGIVISSSTAGCPENGHPVPSMACSPRLKEQVFCKTFTRCKNLMHTCSCGLQPHLQQKKNTSSYNKCSSKVCRRNLTGCRNARSSSPVHISKTESCQMVILAQKTKEIVQNTTRT